MEAKVLLRELREHLKPLNEKILNHPYILEVEKGILPEDRIKTFVINQHYIINGDARSLSLMLSKSKNSEELYFFKIIAEGDIEALNHLLKMAETLGLERLEDYSPIPEAVVYTHYLTALAQFYSSGVQAMALIANLPVWGSNCCRFSKALKEKYQIKETSFLDLFSASTEEMENKALNIIDYYLPEEEKAMRMSATFIQAYELMFWDGIYKR
jgi:thiaminase